MNSNPYRYRDSLNPVKDNLVCIPREEEISSLINGLKRGDYWAILGPEQIGKTTLLRLLQHIHPNAHYIYFNFKVSPADEVVFYQSLMDRFLTEIPYDSKKLTPRKWKDNPKLMFFDFLMTFKPRDYDKKIILMFDEIDNLPFIEPFLRLWRKIFHDRYQKEELNKYAVIITGSVDLIAQTKGKTSPFNIAEILYIKDFSEKESRQLIEAPLKHLNFSIEEKAVDKLVAQISGHPQMLQHACSLLVGKATPNPGKALTVQDVDNTLQVLLTANTNLEALKKDLGNPLLKRLLEDILNGKKKKYYLYKELAIAGSGAIVERDDHCAIRNAVYEKFLKNLFAAE
jgi:energy-coupling factor transporter ATP-binding protein EcfA2